MKGIGAYLDLHATALGVRAKRNKVLASNIANAARQISRRATSILKGKSARRVVMA